MTTIQNDVDAQNLTSDLTLVTVKISDVGWQCGSTTREQGSMTFNRMLSRGGRESAQSTVSIITDGRYTHKYQTAEKVPMLRRKNV